MEAALATVIDSKKIKTSLIDRYAFASDAGFYYLLPKAIVQPSTTEEIKQLFAFAHEKNIPITFRTGGTSLSGQSITDGILVDLGKYWRYTEPLDNGNLIKVEPGIIGAHVNNHLKPFGKKIGPDPASISAAMMGGILSNNSSGMCCGVIYNAYHTLHSIYFILPNGSEYNTATTADYTRFENEQEALAKGLFELKHRLLNNQSLVEKIKTKYRIKNTVGYCINAFIDYEHPLDILAHLLIGAEGTLAFIASAVLRTIPDKPFKKTGLLFFENPVLASQQIPALAATGAEALELMDRPALHSVEHLDDCPALVKGLPEAVTAILCEYQSESSAGLETLFNNAKQVIARMPLTAIFDFTGDVQEQARLWKIRKGLFPSVAAVRAKGTTAMLEDVAVPVESLGGAVTDLQLLFKQYGYDNAIIFGHAKEGNLHFLITQPVNTAEERKVFQRFNDDLVKIIVGKYNGSLKAEHGTGRIVAPYVEDEWGPEAYMVMQELKKLVDPANILNPGVIINTDKECHLKNMKSMPVVEEEVDKCVECGYCENRCPSRDYTLTPRKRIQVRRAMQRMKSEGDEEQFDNIAKQYRFSGMDTCAVDGMCATDCPVDINTGELIKRLRRENHSAGENKAAMYVAKHFGFIEKTVKIALNTGNALNAVTGKKGMALITGAAKKLFAEFPLWMPSLTKPVKIKANNTVNADVVYFPTCITRMMGADETNNRHLPDVLKSLCDKAGMNLFIADNTTGVCCGQLFSSKGFLPAYNHTINNTVTLLWQWTNEGHLPVVVDVTSCTHSLLHALPYLNEQNKERYKQIKFLDSIEFADQYLLPKLHITKKKQSIVFHPVCSVYKMNLHASLNKIGKACAEHTTVPFLSGCCGMAGDRGFYYPELTASATRDLAAEINTKQYDGYYSSGKTCEMAMSSATGHHYRSLLYLLDECT